MRLPLFISLIAILAVFYDFGFDQSARIVSDLLFFF